jgi:formamidopyrimidine-DNA glycosylase
MPELPEVATISAQLNFFTPVKIIKILTGIHFPKFIKAWEFSLDEIIGEEILHFTRLGKNICLTLEKEKRIIVNLGMSGSWRVSKMTNLETKGAQNLSSPEIIKHTHLRIITELKNLGSEENIIFDYIDPRRFGKFYFFTLNSFNQFKETKGRDLIGDPLSTQELKNIFQKHPNLSIKQLLLEQKYFPGIGNYLASEICAHSKILPQRPSHQFTDKKNLYAIINAIKLTLTSAIKSQGTTFQGAYMDTNGNKGEGVKNLIVFYQKVCGGCKVTATQKIYLGGRGTYYCPLCQK